MEITRKCKFCEKQINLETDKPVLKGKIYYHYECFVKLCLSKKTNKKTELEIRMITDALFNLNKKMIQDIVSRRRLYEFLQNHYDIVVIPNYFFVKMEKIFSGEYKGLREGIDPRDILIIWQKKKGEFDRLNDYQKRQGKVIDGSNRLNYDLAIVLGKYDSYLQWKAKQSAIMQDNEQALKPSGINFEGINKSVESNIAQQVQNEKDISDYLEEI